MLSNPYPFLVATLFMIPGVLLAIPAHEIGHALAAHLMGDPTARNRGFLRLDDPRKYFTPYGLAMLVFWRTGWGAQVPVNEYRLTTTPKRIAYALAGPAANLILAIVLGLAVRVIAAPFEQGVLIQPFGPLAFVNYLLFAAFFVNLSVMAFNLLPVPGFDGWRVVEALFRSRNPRFFVDVSMRLQQIQYFLLIGIFIAQFVAGNVLGLAMAIFYQPAATLILGQCAGYIGLIPCLQSGSF